MNQKYQEYLESASRKHGQKFDASELDSRFIQFYHTDTRIKVQRCGVVATGTVSVTTGFRPCFLLMHTNRSVGSIWTLGPKDNIIAIKIGTRYCGLVGRNEQEARERAEQSSELAPGESIGAFVSKRGV